MSLSVDFLSAKLDEFIAPSGDVLRLRSGLNLGDCSLANNLPFLGEFLDFVAQSEAELIRFEDYSILFRKKPREPKTLNDEVLREAAEFLKTRPAPSNLSPQQALKTVALTLQQKRFEEEASLHEKLRSSYTNTLEGYAQFLLSEMPKDQRQFFSKPRSLKLSEESRCRHTLLTSGTGGGKSETLKVLVHHYLTENRDTAVIVMDPHSDLADQIARFQENEANDRLVFVDLTLSETHTPIMNPFDVGDLSDQEREIVLEQILEGMGTILSEEAQFTDQMKALLSPCLETLIKLPDASLEHLKQFLDEDRNAPLKAAANTLLTSPGDLDFLKRDFDSQSYAPTKQGIRNRLHSLLTKPRFRNFVVGKSTINLEEAISEKKIIVFKLAKLTGEDPVAVAIGRLIVTSILGVVMKRARLTSSERKECVPVHLFVDEAHNYAHPSLKTVLAESRKYRLHLTLATQFLSQFSNGKLRSNIESNTAIKIAGLQARGTASAQETTKLMGLPAGMISKLNVGEFYVQAENAPSYLLQVKPDLIDNSHSMSLERWDRVKEEQLKKYYHPIQTPEEAAESYTYVFKKTDTPLPKPNPSRKKLN